LGDVVLLPGLVNAHTHLELSHLAGLVPPAESMAAWIGRLIATRFATAASPEAASNAAREMHVTGTAVVGDISNSLSTSEAIMAAGLAGVIFHELIGFRAQNVDAMVADAWARIDRLRTGHQSITYTPVAHSPYSVSPALFHAIAAARRIAPLAVHLGESLEEIEFLAKGTGPIRATLEQLGAWTDDWEIPHCDPVEYLSRVGYLVPGCLVVHGVHLTDAALGRLRDAGAVIVTCPRSNIWVGSGPAPASRFYRSGVPVAIGTDSLASTDSLSMFDELAAVRAAAPDVEARRLLDSATRAGAEALGFGAEFGTLEAGKRAALVAVEIPAGESSAEDVEEYLVSGVPASRITRPAAPSR
jgi:cytosine/adenosine deaminase-related metal-dependent hydrolase